MIDTLKELISILNSLTPLGLGGGLAYIIYQLVMNKRQVHSISDNHLSGLPNMQDTMTKIADSLDRQEDMLRQVNDGINYLKGRVNGRG